MLTSRPDASFLASYVAPCRASTQGSALMKRVLFTLVFSLSALSITACADEASDTETSTLALSDAEAEALEACISDIEDCRATTESAEEFRELCGELYACMPERESEGARIEDRRAFSADVAERCTNAEASDEDCVALQDRCDQSFSEAEEQGERTEATSGMSEEMALCIRSCQEAGVSDAECRAECSGR